MSKGGVKYTIIALDHIPKWAEAKPLIMITMKKVINFAMYDIICRIRVIYKIITNNGTRFGSIEFKDFYNRYLIAKSIFAISHP